MHRPITMNDQQALDLPGPRISRITIARLHNLGNYEHVRYEVTVELPPGTSPASVLHRTEQMLNALSPRSPHSAIELMHARDTVKVGLKPDATAYERDNLRAAERRLQIHREWQQKRDAAQLAFDELGGTRIYTDAKDDWRDEDF